MGNIISTARPLNLSTSQLDKANNGTGAGEFVDCCGAFLTRERMYRSIRGLQWGLFDKKKDALPQDKDIPRLAEVCPDAQDNYQDVGARKILLRRLSQFGVARFESFKLL